MRFLRIIQNAARWLVRRRQGEAELAEEFRYHLEQEIENNVRSGMNLEEARSAALLLIGPISYHQEECRDSRGTAFLENFLRDLRYAESGAFHPFHRRLEGDDVCAARICREGAARAGAGA